MIHGIHIRTHFTVLLIRRRGAVTVACLITIHILSHSRTAIQRLLLNIVVERHRTCLRVAIVTGSHVVHVRAAVCTTCRTVNRIVSSVTFESTELRRRGVYLVLHGSAVSVNLDVLVVLLEVAVARTFAPHFLKNRSRVVAVRVNISKIGIDICKPDEKQINRIKEKRV